ncbi:hypothetical protein EON65_03120 [archaeon]|nr:MAG: hypothetical protein EON65_03120 [archaeon]
MTSFTGLELAQDYIQWDPNPCTRTVIEELLKAGAFDELDSLLKHRLQFGTAGLRAPMGPGYKNINDLVILQTCQGLCRYLESLDDNCKQRVRN